MGNTRRSHLLRKKTAKRMRNSTSELNSESRVKTTMGTHQFTIHDYSLQKGRGIAASIFSKRFSVGKHDWAIRCDLDGNYEKCSSYISMFLKYYPKSENDKVRVTCRISLLDRTTGAAAYKREYKSKTLSSSVSEWGWPEFIKRDELEASNLYLRGDSLTIICNVTVIKDPKTCTSRVPLTVKASTLRNQLGTLMSIEKGADITFEVNGQSFMAHRCVLAASSPVFHALVSGQMKEEKEQKIKISDIEAPVFEAILLYIYTDNLPEIEMLTDTGMAQHLLVAADMFGLDNLRLSCEKKLCVGLEENNVCTALTLAEQHNLCNLKSACFKFLSTTKTLVSSTATDGFMHLVRSCPGIEKELRYTINITKTKKKMINITKSKKKVRI